MSDLRGGFPADMAETIKELFPHDSFDDLVQDQEIVYQSLQASNRNNRNSSNQNNRNSSNDHYDAFRYLEGQYLNAENFDSQLALDEAYAMALMEEELANASISGASRALEEGIPARNVDVHSAGTSAGTSAAAMNQDSINPDNMTYEELQSLGESVGVESRGLSAEQIARLPHFKFKGKKKWFFGSETNKKECVICCTKYKDKESLVALPCAHDYHKKCIVNWLKLKKNCPVCQTEVELSGS